MAVARTRRLARAPVSPAARTRRPAAIIRRRHKRSDHSKRSDRSKDSGRSDRSSRSDRSRRSGDEPEAFERFERFERAERPGRFERLQHFGYTPGIYERPARPGGNYAMSFRPIDSVDMRPGSALGWIRTGPAGAAGA